MILGPQAGESFGTDVLGDDNCASGLARSGGTCQVEPFDACL